MFYKGLVTIDFLIDIVTILHKYFEKSMSTFNYFLVLFYRSRAINLKKSRSKFWFVTSTKDVTAKPFHGKVSKLTSRQIGVQNVRQVTVCGEKYGQRHWSVAGEPRFCYLHSEPITWNGKLLQKPSSIHPLFRLYFVGFMCYVVRLRFLKIL